MTGTPVERPQPRTFSRRRAHGWWWWLGSALVIGATLGVIAFLAWKKYSEIRAAMNVPPPPETAERVGIEPVGHLSWRRSTIGIGTILAPRSITVNNEMAGTVAKVQFQPGQVVDEGAVMLTLDTSVESAQLEKGIIAEKFARTALDRNLQLGNSISPKELEDAQFRWEQARAEVEELQAQIARKTMIAPFRARVGLSDVHPGQYLPIGTQITTLQSIDDYLLVEFTLAQSVVSLVKVGDAVTLESAGQKFPAVISAIDAQADRQTRNVRVRARIDNPPEALSPGDSVAVEVEYGPAMELLSVPAEAIRRSPQETFVYLAVEDKEGKLRASAQPVVIATAVGSQIGIAGGLSEGDRLVVQGSFKLQDGALITPTAPAPPGEPQTPAPPPGDETGK